MSDIDLIHDAGSGQTFKYIRDYEEGDLIYGLARRRALFVEGVMAAHASDLRPRVVMVDDMNNQFLGTNAPTTPNQNQLGNQGSGADYTPGAAMSREGALFHAFLRDKVKPKWQPSKSPGKANVNQRVKSASKAGIQWTTTERKKRIHFILDGLDMEFVTGKLDVMLFRTDNIKQKEDPGNKSVTGCELRWLYRQRNNTEIMSRVVFWENDQKLGHAPWDDPRWKKYWDAYVPRSEAPSAVETFLTSAVRGLGSLFK